MAGGDGDRPSAANLLLVVRRGRARDQGPHRAHWIAIDPPRDIRCEAQQPVQARHRTGMQTDKPIALPYRIALLAIAVLAASHFLIVEYPGLVLGEGRGAALHRSVLGDYAGTFARLEMVALLHRRSALAAFALSGVAFFGLYRRWIVFWNACFTDRVTGIDDDLKGLRFPLRDFNPIAYFFKGPPGHTSSGSRPSGASCRRGESRGSRSTSPPKSAACTATCWARPARARPRASSGRRCCRTRSPAGACS